MNLLGKLGIALLAGAAVGFSTQWLWGAAAFAAGATVFTLAQLRAEVRALRESVDDPG